MDSNLLTGRVVLVADRDRDVVDSVAEQLDMCLIHKAYDNDSALQYLLGHTYDFVLLGMEGRDLSDLLETSVMRGFVTVVLLPPPLSPESLKGYTDLELIHFHPKEKISDIVQLLLNILRESRKPLWRRVLERVDAEFLGQCSAHRKRTMI